MRAVAVWPLILPIRAYRLFLSPWLSQECRYQPSCPAYAIEALEPQGPLRGCWPTIYCLARCNLWGGSGHDPAPSITSNERPSK